MYLKSIDLSGFKSFSEPTEVQLESGITCIVGPNGCGKSNIVDSIRWALGELSPKTLRSKSIADVIFNGTRRLSPATCAHVTLTFDNADRVLGVDAAEVAVTRKVYRDGNSEYSINKSACRLKDIRTLFLGTGIGDDGYSIMEGHMVEFLLTAKPHERRLLFDEASGAARFSAKRDEALGKLSKIELDLDRVKDQIELIENERKRLENQARKARTYEKLLKEKKTLETEKTIRAIDDLTAKTQALQKNTVEPKTRDLEIKHTQLDQLYAKIQTLESEKMESEKILQAKNEAFYEAARSRDLTLEKMKHLEERLQEKGSQKTSAREELENQNEQLGQFETELQNLAKEIAGKEASLNAQATNVQEDMQTLKATLTNLALNREEAQRVIRQLKARILDTTQEAVNCKNQALKIHTEISELQAELKIALKEHQRASLEKVHLEELLKENETATQALKQETYSNEQELTSLTKTQEELQAKRAQLEELTFRSLPKEESTRQSELEHWDKLYGDNPRVRGAKAIEELIADGMSGVYGPIGKKIKTSPTYHNYLKDILGEKLQWFLAENAEVAMKTMEAVRSRQSGRVTLVLLDRIGENIRTSNPYWDFVPKGQTTRIADLDHILGSTDLRTKKAIFYLLGPTFIQGSTIYAEAIIHGGEELQVLTESKGLTILEEREEVVRALGDIAKRKTEAKTELELYDNKLTDVKKQITELNRLRQTKSIELAQKIAEAESAVRELNLAQDTSVAIEHETQQKLAIISKRNEELAIVDGKTKEFENAAQTLQKDLLTKDENLDKAVIEEKSEREATLAVELIEQRAQQQLAVLTERKSQIVKSMHTSQVSVEKLERALEALGQEIKTVQNQKNETEKEFGSLEAAKEARGTELQALQQSHETLALKLHELHQEQTALEQNLSSLKEELNQCELELKTLEFEKNRNIEEAARIFEAEGEALTEKITQAKLELATLTQETQDLEETLRRINERVEKLGQINFLAQEEYGRLEERVQFLSAQRDDILKARDDVRHAIDTINIQIEESFSVTYEAVRTKFREIFAQLFEGGEADLALVEGENPMQKGVEIFAQPPGKKLQSLALLSQGEKALTAVSLMFAFFSTKPAPVCVLDEIDAPLDEANVQRFRKLLTKFSENCQFLIISHNKRTMEAANALYGVTMEELGVSKIISVKLEEITAPV